MYAKIRRFQLRPPHTIHTVTCTRRSKDAKEKCLQNSLCDLVLLFHDCCEFGLPVPLFCFISWCSSKPFRLPPSPSPPLYTHIAIAYTHLKHMECHCKKRDVKTTRRQTVVPAQQGETQPARDVAVDAEAPVSKISFQRRSNRTHLQCTDTLGTKNEGNFNLQVCS